MPTHIHLILKQLAPSGISIFVGNVLNSYTRYFNLKHHRKGPLWESKFQNILVKGDEQLLHLTRYIHLNPVTALLTDKPQNWKFSSYNEYLGQTNYPICQYKDLIEFDQNKYKKFVLDRISYQRELAIIKKITLD
jgi:putative transposase